MYSDSHNRSDITLTRDIVTEVDVGCVVPTKEAYFFEHLVLPNFGLHVFFFRDQYFRKKYLPFTELQVSVEYFRRYDMLLKYTYLDYQNKYFLKSRL